jgi:hypothetical protein
MSVPLWAQYPLAMAHHPEGNAKGTHSGLTARANNIQSGFGMQEKFDKPLEQGESKCRLI